MRRSSGVASLTVVRREVMAVVKKCHLSLCFESLCVLEELDGGGRRRLTAEEG